MQPKVARHLFEVLPEGYEEILPLEVAPRFDRFLDEMQATYPVTSVTATELVAMQADLLKIDLDRSAPRRELEAVLAVSASTGRVDVEGLLRLAWLCSLPVNTDRFLRKD